MLQIKADVQPRLLCGEEGEQGNLCKMAPVCETLKWMVISKSLNTKPVDSSTYELFLYPDSLAAPPAGKEADFLLEHEVSS